jgi:non-specific serine/threonine protein kinase
MDAKVWVIGGLTASGASTKVDAYDPATDRWSAGPDLPVGLHHSAAAVYRGEIVIAGGFEDASSLYSKPTDRVLALRGGRWVDLPPLGRPRGAAAAAVVGDSLVVVGGRDASLLIAPTEVFDGTAWHDRAAIPTLRDHLAAVSDARYVYAVGGRYLDPSRTSDVFERYDAAQNRWDTMPPLPTARGGLGLTTLGTRLVAAGGEDASRVFPQVEAFDIAAGAWSSLANLPTPRHGLALGAVGDRVAALVGGTAAGVAPSSVAEVLGPG